MPRSCDHVAVNAGPSPSLPAVLAIRLPRVAEQETDGLLGRLAVVVAKYVGVGLREMSDVGVADALTLKPLVALRSNEHSVSYAKNGQIEIR